jgi:hypothetical protein
MKLLIIALILVIGAFFWFKTYEETVKRREEQALRLVELKKERDRLAVEQAKKDSVDMPFLIKSSDDYDEHRSAFVKASRWLFKEKICTVKDLKEWGWTKSVVEMKEIPVYFTYCGGDKQEYKIFLDVSDGMAWRRNSEGFTAVYWDTNK